MGKKLNLRDGRNIEKLTHAMPPLRLYEHMFRTACDWALQGDTEAAQWVMDELIVLDREHTKRKYESLRTNTDIRNQMLGQPCVTCGKVADSIDHKIPISRGGTNDISNLQPMCRDCNRRKRNTVE